MLHYRYMQLRDNATQVEYDKFKKKYKNTCTFCEMPNDNPQQIVKELTEFYLVQNMFPYVVWDSQAVASHLMVVPKRHVISLQELTASESNELIHTLGVYEDQGYSVYARAPGNVIKSVSHQHTHLIQTKGAVIQ